MKLPSKLPINIISQKLPALNADQLSLLSNSISISPQNVVSIDTNEIINQSTDKSFSIRLLKWVEPFEIAGVEYSLFYTEVDHNYKVGDRVFIEGGNYDSELLIENNPFQSGTDGYKVLYADRCKVVLNILYTGVLPTNEEEIDNFVKVYVASSQYEFEFYCQALSMREDSGTIQNKLQLGFNNFLFLNGTFSITPGSYNLTSFADDFSLSSTSTTMGNKWVIRGTTASNNYFIDITNDVLTDNIIPYLNVGYNNPLSGFYNNGKLKIMNQNFTSGGVDFRNEYIYYWDSTNNIWKPDKTYLPVVISEQIFRDGSFNRGNWNQGLLGQHLKRVEWDGTRVKWNLGSTLNVNWRAGILDSTIFKQDSYFTIFDRTEMPQIRTNAANNGGSGYNYVFNTDFTGGDVINGNIFNMAVTYGTNSTTSVLESYYTGVTPSYSVNLSGGVYYNSDIIFASVSNATLISSSVLNSTLTKVKSVNSEIRSSVFLNSIWLSDRIVKIQDYEESNIVWYDDNSNPISYKMYKFYVTETNWLRLREFQNFYFQDLIINLQSTELLNFFDDKFSIGQYQQTYDLPTSGGKSQRRVMVQLSTKEENRNSPGTISGITNNLQPNDIALPSIDIFLTNGEDFNYSLTASYPRTFIADTIDVSKAYILDSDFVSGLFKNSTWVSGNYFNYNDDYSLYATSSFYTSRTPSNYEVIPSSSKIKIPVSQIGTPTRGYLRDDIFGATTSLSEIAFINGLHYDTTLTGGTNLVKMPDVYKVTAVTNNSNDRTVELEDMGTIVTSVGAFSGISSPLLTKNAQNRYNYLHPVKFENSIISSGIFKRAYFEGCQFDNNEFDVTDRDLSNVSNKRKLLLSDIIFDDNSNTIKNGIVQYSHFLSGSDIWKGGIFHRGIWNTSTFSYSDGATSSTIYNRTASPFEGGVFRNSSWVNGQFNTGLFYKNNTNVAPILTALSNTYTTYYHDDINDGVRWSWQNGDFKNGDFEQSNFEFGNFYNGNFYNSSFFDGIATGGNFGKNNIPYNLTRVFSGTFSNANVINAEFRSENYSVPTTPVHIEWTNGVFNNGLFGVNPTTVGSLFNNYDPSNTNNTAIWRDGTFNGGEFTDIAEWKTGSFNNGKFTSYFGYKNQRPIELSTSTGLSFSWQGGEFNGGQFGRSEGLTNSTWFNGEFNGGIFGGRYWRDGVMTRGLFNGSGTYSTDISNQDYFINSFNYEYYGYWQDGWVTRNKDRFITDQKFFTSLERESTLKNKSKDTKFTNILWANGTFSHFDGEMYNSAWINGTFEDGYFSDSVFNPYLNVSVPNQWVIGTGSTGIIVGTNGATVSGLGGITIGYNFNPNEVYTFQIEITNQNVGNLYIDTFSTALVTSTQSGICSVTYSPPSTSVDLLYFGSLTFRNLIIYPGTESGFRTTDSCIWKNGEAYSSDFYYSKWEQGVFDSYSTSDQGNAWGIIWKDGIVKYMNANNIIWEKGTWRNGNWNGSPFTEKSISGTQTFVYPGFASDLINNIMSYGSQSFATNLDSVYSNWDKLHMNDVFTYSGGTYSYDPFNNNDIFSMAQLPIIGNPIELPSGVYFTYSGLNSRYGNGQMLSGIWENGVWNDGWREDMTIITCDNLSNFTGISKNKAFRTNNWTWQFVLNVLNVGAQSTGLITDFNIGDKVAVGNIVTIDINGDRRLIRDYLTIVDIDYVNTSMTLEVSINFPIRSIERDSENHLIYVTRNVWLNGVFLNGGFIGGVWNNGLFKGYPYITIMEDAQWVDGIFKGGIFHGATDSYIDDNNDEIVYHTGLIQKFDFYDENVSGAPSKFKYNSWIDVNYYKNEGVNINRITNVYKQTALGFTASFVENNFYGYPTMDVLESNSSLRNGFDLNSRSYRLGWKWKEYTDYLDTFGEFVDINEYTYNNFNTTASGFGIDNLLSDGWTFSSLTVTEGFAPATNSIVSNIGSYESEWLYLTGGRQDAQQVPFSSNINFTVDIFDNTNVKIDKLRYSFAEIEAETLNFTQSVSGVVQPVVFYNNYPATYSIAAINTLFNGSNITIPINQIATSSVVKQREYFFNKTDLKMLIFSGPTYSLRFKKIRFVETDMIPFTQITDECILFKTNALWNTTPVVDFPGTTVSGPNDPAHPFPGQWELALPSGDISIHGDTGNLLLIPDNGLPTWDNFYLTGEGNGCTSYVNEDINVPYVAIAPDIDYDSSDFKYLKSANVTISDITG